MTGANQDVTISSNATNIVLTIQGATAVNGSSAIYGILIDNTNSGKLTISAPILLGLAQTWANNSTNLFTVSGAVDNNKVALTIDGTGNTTISGVVSDTGGLVKNGTGTLTLSGSAANTYSGTTTVNGGTLTLAKTGGNAIAGPLVIGDGVDTDTVLLNGSNQINNKAVTINSSGVLDLNNNSDAVGIVTMTAGSITTGTGTFSLGGDLTTNASATSATVAGNFSLGANRNFTVADGTAADDLVISANINSNNANLTKLGAGRMVLTGSNLLHDVQVTAGILNLRNSNALGTGATPTVNSGATLELEGGISIGNDTKLNGSGTSGQGALVNVSGNNTMSGAISLASSSTIGSTSGNLTISGNLNGGGGRSLDFVGAGNTTVTGVVSNLNNGLMMDGTGVVSLFGVNTYNSATTINSGTIAVNSNSSLGQANNAATINAGTLEVTSSFTAARIFILGSSSSTVQVDPGQTFTVGPTNSFNGTGTLNKTGAGTLFLSGPNAYSGGTNITAGIVQLGATNTMPDTGTVSISNGTLDMQTFTDTVGPVILHSGSIIGSGTLTGTSYTVESGSISAPLAGTGTMTKNTSGTVTLSGNDTFTGSTTVNAGTLVLATTSGSALGSTSAITVNSGGTLLLGASNQINNSAPMSLAGGTFATGNFSEGTATTKGLGALTLTASSVIDFGTGTGSLVNFADFVGSGNTLTINNWTGTPNTAGNALTDRLLFDRNLSAAEVNEFSFTGYLGAAEIALGGGVWEVVPLAPVPEPSTWIGASLAIAVLGFNFHRRRQRRVAVKVAPLLILGVVPLLTSCGGRTTTSVAAKILAVKQNSQITPSTLLHVGQQLSAGDVCRLNSGQEVTIAFTPAVMAELLDDASIVISKLRLGRDGNETGHDMMEREIEIRCLSGSIIGSVPADALKTHFIINTEAGTVSVEPGSVFYVSVSDPALRITCPRGAIRFTATNSADVIIVPPGKWLVYEKGATTRSQPQAAFENARAQQDVTLALEAEANMQALLAAEQRAVPSWRHL